MELDCKTVSRRRFQTPLLVMWFVAALGVPFQFVLQSTPNVMIADLMQALNISEPNIGFLTSSFFYTYLIFQVPAGILVDRYGARVVLSVSVLLGSLACLQFAHANSFGMAESSRLIMGLVTAPCVPAIMFFAAKNFSATRFVILAGLAESIGMTGGAVGEAVLGEVATNFGWRQTMLACAVVGVVIALLMFTLIRDRKREPQLAKDSAGEFKQIISGFIHVMKNSQVWLIVLYGALIFAMLPAMAGLWIVQTLQDIYRVKLEIGALGSAAMFFGTALGLPFWGWISERIRKRRPVMFFATSANILLTASFIYLDQQPLAIVFIQLFFMGFVSAVYVLAFALVRERTHECVRASAMGLTNMMTMVIGAPILQPLIGSILEFYHVTGENGSMSAFAINRAYQYALSTVMVCLVLALALVFFIKETHCKSQVQE